MSDLLRHAYVIGQTGTGKSTTLYNVALQLIAAGEGVAFVDPHGEEAEALLEAIPSSRIRDVVYFNPQDEARPIGINLLEVSEGNEHLVAASVVEVLRGLYADSWGPRMDWILYNCLRTIAAAGGTVLDVPRLLADPDFRGRMIEQVRDPAVVAFWREEFDEYGSQFQTEAISPIQNKVGRLRADPVLRGILGQRHSTIDPRFMMDERRILIANLSSIGTAAADILGSFLSTWFQIASLGRTGPPNQGPVPFTLILDECHRFTTERIATILAESRKHGLGLVLANQYTAQLTGEIQDAIFGNVGTTLSFRVGGADGPVMERHFGGAFRAEQFTELDRFDAYVKGVREGPSTEPFRATMLPPIENDRGGGRKQTIIRESRRRFTREREVVEPGL
ncbi:MAG: type IV secretory system conjugative DNA transfer family protein [Salinibacter sp.]|uniref:type IV secretory system conjugative DNA transfer family protein n=1 Tax=Salinibacter sp. TaxID=2065818 RepID=UPI0035D4CBA5